MRITIPCEDYKRYKEIPKSFLPERPKCLNNQNHKPYWNNHWERGFLPDHVHEVKLEIFQAYCKECRETISYWPEFVLPYQREALETHESVLVEHLQGKSFKEIGTKIGYSPRTVSRWVSLTLEQASQLWSDVIGRILQAIGNEVLSVTATSDWRITQLLLAWLRRFADWIHFPRLYRLMGLCNLFSEGWWDLWGAPLGNAKSRVNFKSPPT
jgi:transposase